jgi:MerR family transcriptional regulator, heat shock protein HspR
MTRPLTPRNVVARQLAISPRTLVRYEQLGLVRVTHDGPEEGYEPSQVRRIWTITSFQRDLGINLAGVEVILRLQDQMCALHERLDGLASELRELLETDTPAQQSPQSPRGRSRRHD